MLKSPVNGFRNLDFKIETTSGKTKRASFGQHVQGAHFNPTHSLAASPHAQPEQGSSGGRCQRQGPQPAPAAQRLQSKAEASQGAFTMAMAWTCSVQNNRAAREERVAL